MSYNTFSPIVTNSLLLCVDAANKKSYPGSGTNWIDLTSNGNNGTLLSPTFNTLNGGSIIFDGIDDYVNFSDVPLRISNYNFTLEVIFYFNGNDYTNAPIIGKRSSNSPFNGWTIGINNGSPYLGGTGKVILVFLRDDNNPNSPIYDRVLTYTLPSAGVYHLTLTNSQSQAQLWANGVLVSTSAVVLASGSFNITGFNFRIGNYYTATYWNEKVYLSRVYNRTLTSSEVLQNYNATKGRFI